MPINWGAEIVGQLEFYWEAHLRPRLEGLTDDEYFWEPVPGCWSVRPGPEGSSLDWEYPEPVPPPFTTIAWRLVHIGGTLYARANAFFGDGTGSAGADVSDRNQRPTDADMFDRRHLPTEVPGSAAAGIALLEEGYRRWHDGVAALDEQALARPLGPKGVNYADYSMAALVLHLNREVMHHGGEIGVLRDLYRAEHGDSDRLISAGASDRPGAREPDRPGTRESGVPGNRR